MKVCITIRDDGTFHTHWGGLHDNRHTDRVFAVERKLVEAVKRCQDAPHTNYSQRKTA